MDAAEIARLWEINEKATPGPWAAGCLADDAHPCNCRSVLCESYMGAVASVEVDNGLSISEGGNDAPPTEEAKANLRYIAAFDPPTTRALLDALEQARKERNNFRVQLDAELTKEASRKGILTKANNERIVAEIERDQAQQERDDATAHLHESNDRALTLAAELDQAVSRMDDLAGERDAAQQDAKDARALLEHILVQRMYPVPLDWRARIEAMLE